MILLTPRTRPSEWDGRWCGDQIEMVEDLPVGECWDVAPDECGEWLVRLIFATNDEMVRLTSSVEFARLREKRGITVGTNGSILLHGAVEALLDIATWYGKSAG